MTFPLKKTSWIKDDLVKHNTELWPHTFIGKLTGSKLLQEPRAITWRNHWLVDKCDVCHTHCKLTLPENMNVTVAFLSFFTIVQVVSAELWHRGVHRRTEMWSKTDGCILWSTCRLAFILPTPTPPPFPSPLPVNRWKQQSWTLQVGSAPFMAVVHWHKHLHLLLPVANICVGCISVLPQINVGW